MTVFNKKLYNLWSSFDVPAYISGHVPPGASFPYITFDVAKGDAFADGVLTAFNWHKAVNGDSAME